MVDYDVHAGDVLLAGLFAVLGWLARSKFKSYDADHAKHFEHEERRDIHQTSMDQNLISAKLDNVHLEIAHMGDNFERHVADDRIVNEQIRKDLVANGNLVQNRFDNLEKIVVQALQKRG